MSISMDHSNAHNKSSLPKKLRFLGVALIAGSLILSGCSSGSDNPSPGPDSPGTDAQIPLLRWGNGPFDGLDPATAASNFSSTAAAPALESLIGFDADLKIKPILAESYSRPDATHYVYKIRSGVTFWDGSPLTAEDVAFSLDRHRDPELASMRATMFTNVTSITVTGDDEVTVELESPDPQFEFVPSQVPILSKAFVEATGAKLGTPGGSTLTVMGTGPMKITNYDDTGVTYEAWDGYWGTKSRVDKLELLTFQSPDASRLAYQSGDIDGTFYGLSGDTLSAWQGIANSKLIASEPINVGYLALNTTQEPFSDIHARRALAYAADLEGFQAAFTGEAGEVPTSIIPPVYFANLGTQAEIDAVYAQIPQYPFDLDKAKEELAQSNYPNGFEVTVPYTPQFPISGSVLVSMSETLKEVGITFNPEPMPISNWGALHQGNDSPILWGYWLPDWPDPSNIASLFFPSAGAVPGRNNKAHWQVPEVDQLLTKQMETTDAAVRLDALGQLLEMVGDQVPYLPLWWERAVMVVKDDKFVYSNFNAMFYVNNWVENISSAT